MAGMAALWCVVAMATATTTTATTRHIFIHGNVSVRDAFTVDDHRSCIDECTRPITSQCSRRLSDINTRVLYPDHFVMRLPSGRVFMLQTSIVECINTQTTEISMHVYEQYLCNFSMNGYDHILKLSVKADNDSNPSYQATGNNNWMEQQLEEVINYINVPAMTTFSRARTLSYNLSSEHQPRWVKLYVIKYACCNNCSIAR